MTATKHLARDELAGLFSIPSEIRVKRMSDAGRHLADIGTAIMAIAGIVLSAAQAATPVVATMTTFMAGLWWALKWWRAIRRWWRQWREARRVDV